MSNLFAELEKLQDLLGTLPKRRILPPNQARPTRRILEKVLTTLDVEPTLPEARLQQVKREILKAQKAGGGFNELPARTLRDACALLWPKANDGIDRASLVIAIFDQAKRSSSTLRRLIDNWIMQFDASDTEMAALGKALGDALKDKKGGILAQWGAAHAEFAIFDADRGPIRLAQALQENRIRALEACRFDNPIRAAAGYIRAVHKEFSRNLPKSLATSDMNLFACAIEFYAPSGVLRFKEEIPNGQMADALVAPWIGKQRVPSDAMRAEVLAFLRDHLGDPRLDIRRGWAGASDDTRQTVRAWLSQLSLDAFFNIIGQFAESAGMNHQWKRRQAFWGSCLRKGYIVDSWLILGDNVARAISTNRDLQGSYGRLFEGHANHSVLLMKIGSLIFAEWSHNGKLRAWPLGWKQTPPLFRASYSRSELTASCLQFPYPIGRADLGATGSDGLVHIDGTWQGRVAALLQKREGIALSPRDWGG